MILVVIAVWLAYKRAKDSDRNGVKWAIITFISFIATQLIVAFGMGIALGLYVGFNNLDDAAFRPYELAINLVSIAASIGVALLILRHLGKIPEETTYVSPPPPPSSFQ